MKKDERLEILKRKDLKEMSKNIEEKGKFSVLSEFSSFFDKRTYFKVDSKGNIKVKEYNPIILLFAFCDDKTKLAEFIFKYSYPEEKQNIRKIDRCSNVEIPDLKENLMKTLVSGNLNFSKIFAKELFLRDREEFFKVLYTFSAMGNPKHIKLLYVYALEKIMNKVIFNENILYIVISYLTKIRDEFNVYLKMNDDIKLDLNKENLNEDKIIYLKIFNDIFNKNLEVSKLVLTNSEKSRVTTLTIPKQNEITKELVNQNKSDSISADLNVNNKNKFINNLYFYFNNEDFILNEDLKKVLS